MAPHPRQHEVRDHQVRIPPGRHGGPGARFRKRGQPRDQIPRPSSHDLSLSETRGAAPDHPPPRTDPPRPPSSPPSLAGEHGGFRRCRSRRARPAPRGRGAPSAPGRPPRFPSTGARSVLHASERMERTKWGGPVGGRSRKTFVVKKGSEHLLPTAGGKSPGPESSHLHTHPLGHPPPELRPLLPGRRFPPPVAPNTWMTRFIQDWSSRAWTAFRREVHEDLEEELAGPPCTSHAPRRAPQLHGPGGSHLARGGWGGAHSPFHKEFRPPPPHRLLQGPRWAIRGSRRRANCQESSGRWR